MFEDPRNFDPRNFDPRKSSMLPKTAGEKREQVLETEKDKKLAEQNDKKVDEKDGNESEEKNGEKTHMNKGRKNGKKNAKKNGKKTADKTGEKTSEKKDEKTDETPDEYTTIQIGKKRGRTRSSSTPMASASGCHESWTNSGSKSNSRRIKLTSSTLAQRLRIDRSLNPSRGPFLFMAFLSRTGICFRPRSSNIY